MVRRGLARLIPTRKPTVTAVAAAHLGAVLAGWATLRYGADRWWPATVLMYGPKWVWLAPLGLTIPWTALARSRKQRRIAGVMVLATTGAVLGPVMGLRAALPYAQPPRGPTLKILTLNTDGDLLDGVQLGALLRREQPDVVLLQAWSSRFEIPVFGGPAPLEYQTGHATWQRNGWHLRRDGNLLIASRHPILRGQRPMPPPFAPCADGLAWYELATPAGPVRVINTHLASPRDGLVAVWSEQWRGGPVVTRNTAVRLAQAEYVAACAIESRVPVILAGDMNMTTDSRIYQDAFARRFLNAFDQAGVGWGHTHLTRRTALRIDHVLVGAGWRVRRCRVGPYVGSAHRPVIADIEWVGPSITSTQQTPAPATQPVSEPQPITAGR